MIRLVLLPLLFLSIASEAKPPAPKISKSLERSLSAAAVARAEIDNAFSFVPRLKVNTVLGVTVLEGSAFTIGTQIGIAPFPDVPFYVGPDFNFSLYAQNVYLLTTMASAWYELHVHAYPRLCLFGGVSAGGGFTRRLPFDQTTWAAFADFGISQDVDDLFSVRGQFRPGFVQSVLAFMMNFNVSFRF